MSQFLEVKSTLVDKIKESIEDQSYEIVIDNFISCLDACGWRDDKIDKLLCETSMEFERNYHNQIIEYIHEKRSCMII